MDSIIVYDFVCRQVITNKCMMGMSAGRINHKHIDYGYADLLL